MAMLRVGDLACTVDGLGDEAGDPWYTMLDDCWASPSTESGTEMTESRPEVCWRCRSAEEPLSGTS